MRNAPDPRDRLLAQELKWLCQSHNLEDTDSTLIMVGEIRVWMHNAQLQIQSQSRAKQRLTDRLWRIGHAAGLGDGYVSMAGLEEFVIERLRR